MQYTNAKKIYCALEQTLHPSLVSYTPASKLLLPLSKSLGPVDLSANDHFMLENNIGYTPVWSPGSLMGSAMFGGNSFGGMSSLKIPVEVVQSLASKEDLTIMLWVKPTADVSGTLTLLV